MSKPIYNDDVERVVNPRTAEARQRTEEARQRTEHMINRKVHRLLLTIVAMLAGILAGIVLWLLNVSGSILTIMVMEVLSCVAAFAAGRLWEVIRK